MKTTLPDFRGKTVSFSTAESTLAVDSPQFQEQGGRLFVVARSQEGALLPTGRLESPVPWHGRQ